MIKRSKLFGNKTRVTFCLPVDQPAGPVSVVGTFNDWRPGEHELKARRDGTRTISLQLGPGHYSFRYLGAGGVWLDDEYADGIGPHGSELRLWPAFAAVPHGHAKKVTKLSIIYYSSTGTLHAMAERLQRAGEKAGAEVRLRQVAELAPAEAIASNAAWSQHFDRTKDEPKATADDVTWADAVLFGSPTRYGNVASQLKQFLDTLGPQWAQGLLADKAYAGFTASQTRHGGQESTLLALYNTIHHFGGVVVAPGYTDPLKFGDGNPYGVSHVTGPNNDAPLADEINAALDHLAERLVRIGGKLSA